MKSRQLLSFVRPNVDLWISFYMFNNVWLLSNWRIPHKLFFILYLWTENKLSPDTNSQNFDKKDSLQNKYHYKHVEMRHTFHFGLIWKIGDLIQPICRRITKLSGYFENITFHQDYLYSNKTKALICMARHTLNILRVACKETLSSSQQIGISALHKNEKNNSKTTRFEYDS